MKKVLVIIAISICMLSGVSINSLNHHVIGLSLNVSQSKNTNVQLQLAQMVKEKFGDDKWKIAMADGQFTNGFLKILSSLKDVDKFSTSINHYSELKVKSILMWSKLYILATSEYQKALQKLIENQQLQQGIIDSVKQQKDSEMMTAMKEFTLFTENL